jgi:hypothetical protein
MIPSNVLGMGEHPARSARHHQGLIDEWQPTIHGLVLRLAYLMWRKECAHHGFESLSPQAERAAPKGHFAISNEIMPVEG